MPEGDTIHRIARVLGRELTGRTLDRIEVHDRGEVPELAERRVEEVRAIGKHMIVILDGGWSLRIHLGMHGRWRRAHVRERRPRNPTVVLISGDTAYICDRAYRAETIRTSALRSHPRLARLGPDLLAEPPEIDAAVRRAHMSAHAGREIADVLLDQRIAAGIGNVYKSEVLFECGINPRARVGDLTEQQVRELYETAARLMRLNLLTRRRTAVPLKRRPTPSSARLWVYGRMNKPCRDCGTPIQRFLQGDMGRRTYFCPGCQPAQRG